MLLFFISFWSVCVVCTCSINRSCFVFHWLRSYHWKRNNPIGAMWNIVVYICAERNATESISFHLSFGSFSCGSINPSEYFRSLYITNFCGLVYNADGLRFSFICASDSILMHGLYLYISFYNLLHTNAISFFRFSAKPINDRWRPPITTTTNSHFIHITISANPVHSVSHWSGSTWYNIL